jgi:hypothetical protein
MRIIRAAAPPGTFPEEFPGDEDLEFLGEVPSPAEIAATRPGIAPTTDPGLGVVPKGFALEPKAPPGTPPGRGFYEVVSPQFVREKMEEKIEPGKVVPEDPAQMFEEVSPEEPDKKSIAQKVWEAINDPSKILRITYKTLPDEMGRTATTVRNVSPDYVWKAGTNNWLLVAWCHLKNDWRRFVVDNILQAELEA